MAFWGAPINDDKHAQNAVLAALSMQKLCAKLSHEFVAKGWPKIESGIGINSGEMNVGDMGSEFRRAYTVLGDAVNLGSRLEGLTKFYGVDILVSEACAEQCPDILFRPIDRVRVKGKQQAVNIFQPIAQKQEVQASIEEELALHRQAFNAYLAQRWTVSEQLFIQLQTEFSQRVVYDLFMQRIQVLKNQPPNSSWDGSFTHKLK